MLSGVPVGAEEPDALGGGLDAGHPGARPKAEVRFPPRTDMESLKAFCGNI